MAKLLSTGIAGFLASAKRVAGDIVEHFLSGFAGYGWKIWEYTSGKWMLEIDSIRARGQFVVFELLASKIRALIGSLAISQACGKIKTVSLSDDGQYYLVTIEDEAMSFQANDFIRCQKFNGKGMKAYHVEVSAVVGDVIHLPVWEFEVGSDGEVFNPPATGDDIVQFGNSQDTSRQSAIYIHADEGGQPAIDVMFDIDSKDWTGKVKMRVGGDIPGGGGAKGFYVENGMIKGVDTHGDTTYCIYPNGTAEFGNGSAAFRADKSGFIAGGAIAWEWDSSRNKYVCTMKDVLLQWDNLSDETKDNLKGKDGASYYTWIKYADSDTGSGLSDSPIGKKYIGLAYNKTTATESNTASDYIWSLIKGDKGDTGVPGGKGEDGATLYTWIKYAPSEDGSNMTDVPDGNTKYIGIAVNKTTATESNNKEDYTWSLFKGEDGVDANLLPWVSEWNNNKTLIGGEYVVSPKMFSGTRNEATGKLTGVAQGRECITIDGVKRTGIFALVEDDVVFELDPITKKYVFNGTINSTGGIFKGSIKYISAGEDWSISSNDFSKTQTVHYEIEASSSGTSVGLILPADPDSTDSSEWHKYMEGAILTFMWKSHKTYNYFVDLKDSLYVNGTDVFFRFEVKTTDKYVITQVICFKDASNTYTYEMINAYSRVRGSIPSL